MLRVGEIIVNIRASSMSFEHIMNKSRSSDGLRVCQTVIPASGQVELIIILLATA